MSRYSTIGQLFEIEPDSWGLRGDPNLWRAMRDYFFVVSLPSNATELEKQIEHAFQQLAGHSLQTPEHFFVEEFAHGGMSSGGISPEYWRESGLRLLLARFAERESGERSN